MAVTDRAVGYSALDDDGAVTERQPESREGNQGDALPLNVLPKFVLTDARATAASAASFSTTAIFANFHLLGLWSGRCTAARQRRVVGKAGFERGRSLSYGVMIVEGVTTPLRQQAGAREPPAGCQRTTATQPWTQRATLAWPEFAVPGATRFRTGLPRLFKNVGRSGSGKTPVNRAPSVRTHKAILTPTLHARPISVVPMTSRIYPSYTLSTQAR